MGNLATYVFLCMAGAFVVFMGLMICLAMLVRVYRAVDTLASSMKKPSSVTAGCPAVTDSSHVLELNGEETSHDGDLEGPVLGAGPVGDPAEGLGILAEVVPHR